MMRIFAMMTLVVGIIYLSGSAFMHLVAKENSNALLIMSGIDRKATEARVLEYYRTTIINNPAALADSSKHTLSTQYTNIDQDGQRDLIAILESEETCGTGGCIATIFLQNEIREFEPIEFRYAVREIEVLESITNGMHDIRLNGDEASRMIWNGERYLPEAI